MSGTTNKANAAPVAVRCPQGFAVSAPGGLPEPLPHCRHPSSPAQDYLAKQYVHASSQTDFDRVSRCRGCPRRRSSRLTALSCLSPALPPPRRMRRPHRPRHSGRGDHTQPGLPQRPPVGRQGRDSAVRPASQLPCASQLPPALTGARSCLCPDTMVPPTRCRGAHAGYAAPGARGRTPLIKACVYGHDQLVTYLLGLGRGQGVSIHEEDDSGMDALQWCDTRTHVLTRNSCIRDARVARHARAGRSLEAITALHGCWRSGWRPCGSCMRTRRPWQGQFATALHCWKPTRSAV